jgi:hypothetical protein
MATFDDVLDFTRSWANRTDQILKDQLREKKIGVTKDLFQSLRHKVYQKAGDQIGADFSFLTYGRFRDMGAGSGSKASVIEQIRTNGDIIQQKSKGRKPARWYSRPFYGRIHALMGAVGYAISEQAVRAVVDELKSTKS